MNKYLKTAHLSALEKTNGGIAYLLRELSETDGVVDVSFTQTSLEERLANLYSKWKASGGS